MKVAINEMHSCQYREVRFKMHFESYKAKKHMHQKVDEIVWQIWVGGVSLFIVNLPEL